MAQQQIIAVRELQWPSSASLLHIFTLEMNFSVHDRNADIPAS